MFYCLYTCSSEPKGDSPVTEVSVEVKACECNMLFTWLSWFSLFP